ncbi:MAG: ATP-binding protein [Thermoplasmata archaeon]
MEALGAVYEGNTEIVKIRLNPGIDLKLGEMIVAENERHRLVYKVVDIEYQGLTGNLGSEIISGNILSSSRNGVLKENIYGRDNMYKKISAIPLLDISRENPKKIKIIPDQFSIIRKINIDDIKRMNLDNGNLLLGYIRNGDEYNKDFQLRGDAREILSHHVFIVASTGRGKSNATKVMINSLLDSGIGIFTIDPHNEYHEIFRNRKNVSYYSKNTLNNRGANSIKIDLNKITPEDLENTGYFTDTQIQAFVNRYKNIMKKGEFKTKENRVWLDYLFDKNYSDMASSTEKSLRRKFEFLFNANIEENIELYENNIFTRENIVKDSVENMVEDLEAGRIVILDSSNLDDMQAILIESMVANRIYERHFNLKNKDRIEEINNVVFVIEEARIILSNEFSKNGNDNIFMRIAREGRKFRIGLIAISQLITPIDSDILSNINTFIILGLENSNEINKVVESTPTYLEMEKSIIRSLGKGEAIISSIFFDFPVPVYFPKIEDLTKNEMKKLPGKIIGGSDV